MHAEDAGLRRIQDRRGQQRTEYAAVGDREGAALHVLQGELAILGPDRVVDDGVLDLVHAEGVRVPDYRHHETAVRTHRNADVVVAVVDDVVAVDGGVHGGKAFQRLHAGAHEETHEAELGAVVTFPELVAVAPAHGHDRTHVHLVEGGQHRGSLLGLH